MVRTQPVPCVTAPEVNTTTKRTPKRPKKFTDFILTTTKRSPVRPKKLSVGADLTTTKRPPPRRPKKLSNEDILTTLTEPERRIRKCVVKIRRIKVQKGVGSEESRNDPPDASTFEPARNSTMYAPPKVQKSTIPQDIKEMVADSKTSPFRQRIGRICLSGPAAEISAKKSTRFFHRDQTIIRRRSSVTRNVFDFLSQSQIEDDNDREDPAADIIKRMVKDGKACVMVRSKVGKTRVKRTAKKVRPVGRRRKISTKDKEPEPVQVASKPKEPRLQKPSRCLSTIFEPEEDSSNDSEQGYVQPIEVPVQVHVEPSTSKQPHDGAYSNLARSVMLNQTQAQSSLASTDRRRELINKARQLVSTPLNRRVPPVTEVSASTAALSPITRQSPNAVGTTGGASPWRVSDESPLPNTFMFGFNTSQMPSYSSDHVRRRHVYVPDVPVQQSENIPHEESICPPLQEQCHDSNGNDSNEENRPPPTINTSMPINDQESAENTDNFVHLPNPRRTVQKRMPFKDINILEVMTLPPWKKNVPATISKEITPTKVDPHPIATSSPAQRTQTRVNLFGYDDALSCEDIPRKTTTPSKGIAHTSVSFNREVTTALANRNQMDVNTFGCQEISPCENIPNEHTETRTSPSRNLFGFDEFITECEDVPSDSMALSQNGNLHDKLHRLAELRPREGELPQLSWTPNRSDYLQLHSKQMDIRDVFCSTMIALPSAVKRKAAALVARESMGLFGVDQDEPEQSFADKQPRRTYVKERPQRKRKKRVQILYIESESEDENENEQDSHDKSLDSPQKKQQRVKRPRRDIEHEAKLQQFISSFNEQCEEVEKFPVIIE
ncbi:protein dalmatian [Drosophila erecta]|uniref:protein dalmatian n=1 Tax=Drosophila erecta TaxID=7220 RepID=UPI000F05B84D|nr:protein dalmatian [Drosophila erecta]